MSLGKLARLGVLEEESRVRLTARSEALAQASRAAVSPELWAALLAPCDLSEAAYEARYERLRVWLEQQPGYTPTPPHIGAWLKAISADDELYPYPAPCPPDAPPLFQRSAEGWQELAQQADCPEPAAALGTAGYHAFLAELGRQLC